MQGFELVTDRDKKTPAVGETAAVMEICKEKGLFVGKGGLFGNVIRIQPPIALTYQQIEEAMDIIDTALSEVEKGLLK